ncbi:MAG TPA: histidine kinase, partial [Clostridiales bacterium]|nr:histidine kinase [Clostridiales bacterium]
SMVEHFHNTNEYEKNPGIISGKMGHIIKKGILNIDGLNIHYSVNVNAYRLIRIKQTKYLLISIIMNIILIIVISQHQAKRIIKPVTDLNQAISIFPNNDQGIECEPNNKCKKTVSLHERLTQYFIGTTVIPFILFICACYISSIGELKNYITNYSDSIVETEAKTISKIIERKEKSFFMFINEPFVLEAMMHKNDRKEDVGAALDKGVFMGIGKSRVLLMDTSGEILLYNNKTIIDNLKKYIITSETSLTSETPDTSGAYKCFLPVKWKMDRNLLEEFTLMLDVPVFCSEGSKDMKFVGIAAIFIDLWEIENIFYRSNTIFRRAYLIDHTGRVFDVYNKAYISEDESIALSIPKFGNDNKYGIHIIKDIKGLDWQVVSIFSKDYINSKTNSLKRDCIYCLFIVILLSIVYSFFISNQLLKPINRLNYYFNTVKLDSISDINIDEFYIDEIDKIGKNFITMMERIEQLIDELMLSQYNNLALEKIGRKAQIKALQAEITPHFLYNTLDIIINLIRDIKTEKAVSMIQALSDLFRYSITDNEYSTITIGEELRYAESYANILAVHYNEQVRFIWDIEPDIEQYDCMRMFLQPLLENCVVHALNGNDLEVTIKCKVSGEDIIFIVQDNGKGIEEIELVKLRNRIKAENCHDAHIGLNNINSRLKLLYGDLYNLNVDSKRGIGTTIVIKIPAKIGYVP